MLCPEADVYLFYYSSVLLLQCNNFAVLKWSDFHFLAAEWRAELDPLENFLLSKCTGESYGFAYDC